MSKKPVGYRFRGVFYPCNEAIDVLISVFERFHEYDETFHSRFEDAGRDYNSKTYQRNLISKDRDKLYITSPHLKDNSVLMSSGYWIGTTYDNPRKLYHIEKACEILNSDEVQFGKNFTVTLEEVIFTPKEYACNENTRIFVNFANEEVSPENADYGVYFCAYCHCISFLRKPENGSPHFYHRIKPSRHCPQYVGGINRGFEIFRENDFKDKIDYERRKQETISLLIENGFDSWLYENDNEKWLRGISELSEEEKAPVVEIADSKIEEENIQHQTPANDPLDQPSIETNHGFFKTDDLPDGKSVRITGYTGNLKSIDIPEHINGRVVISIGDWAFGNKKLTSVTIPGSVTSIGYYAFANNDLASVTLQNGLTSIGRGAFEVNKLTTLIIPESVTFIDSWAFQFNHISSLTIFEGVTTIGIRAFANNQLTSATIPESVTSIHTEAFAGNKSGFQLYDTRIG